MKVCDQFGRIEKILHNYRLNCARLEYLRSELEELRHAGDVRVQDYSGRLAAGSGNANPVDTYVQKILTLEHRISVLEKYTAPVSRLHDDLRKSTDTMCKHYLRILEYFYFGGLPVSRVLEITHWNKNTFYSRRISLISLAVDYVYPEVNQ